MTSVFVIAGSREGFVLVEQQSHREFDQTKPKGHPANYLPCARNEYEGTLEPSRSKPDT